MNIPERERIQNEQSINQILSKVNRQYGESAFNEMKNFCNSFEKLTKLNDTGKRLYIAINNEDAEGKEDTYDAALPLNELRKNLQDYYGQEWNNELQKMRKKVESKCFSNSEDTKYFNDDEVVALYYTYMIEIWGYDINEMSASLYLQNEGKINGASVLSDSGITRLSDLKRIQSTESNRSTAKIIDDDLDMEYVNHSNLDKTALSYYRIYPEEAGPGYTKNCAYCSLAYDLRQRGYDVEAASKSIDAHTNATVIQSWYEDITTHETAKLKRIYDKSYNGIQKQLLSDTKTVTGIDTKNARGQFIVTWTMGSAHSMIYEVNNGNVTIRDCQINKSYTLEEWYKEHSSYVLDAGFLRTDNKKVRDTALVGVRNRRDD